MSDYTAPQLIAVADIDASDRLRPLDMDWVEALAGSIKSNGLLHAIEVCRLPGQTGYKLVIGGHRLAAFKLLGIDFIPASIGSSDRDDRRTREIVENVFRRDLSPIDRATFIAELYLIEKARVGLAGTVDGRVHSANVRWQKVVTDDAKHATAMIAGAYGMQGAVAIKLGISERTLRDDLLLHKRLPASLVERVRKLPIADNATALRALAKMEPANQIRAVTLMEGGQAKSINDAAAIISKKPPVDAGKKRLKTFTDTFARMGRAEQLEALRVLSGLLPKGAAISFETKPVSDRPDNVVDLEDFITLGAAE